MSESKNNIRRDTGAGQQDPEDVVVDFALRQHFGNGSGDDLSYRVLSRWRKGDRGGSDLELSPARSLSVIWLVSIAALLVVALSLVYFNQGRPELDRKTILATSERPLPITSAGVWDLHDAKSVRAGDSLVLNHQAALSLAGGSKLD